MRALCKIVTNPRMIAIGVRIEPTYAVRLPNCTTHSRHPWTSNRPVMVVVVRDELTFRV
jgi:hypothetical protein